MLPDVIDRALFYPVHFDSSLITHGSSTVDFAFMATMRVINTDFYYIHIFCNNTNLNVKIKQKESRNIVIKISHNRLFLPTLRSVDVSTYILLAVLMKILFQLICF